jgi:hypothetical protein
VYTNQLLIYTRLIVVFPAPMPDNIETLPCKAKMQEIARKKAMCIYEKVSAKNLDFLCKYRLD